MTLSLDNLFNAKKVSRHRILYRSLLTSLIFLSAIMIIYSSIKVGILVFIIFNVDILLFPLKNKFKQISIYRKIIKLFEYIPYISTRYMTGSQFFFQFSHYHLKLMDNL